MAMPLVYSVAVVAAMASRAWVTASMPDAAVTERGMESTRSESTMAISGVSS